jgi:UPF0755 protein
MNRPLRYLVRVFGVLAIAAGTLTIAVAWWLAQPLPLPSSPLEFDVKQGTTLRAVARDLAAQRVLPSDLALIALARWRGVDRTIKAGNYEIESGVTLPQLLDKLTQGDVMQVALTIVEGTTFAELKKALASSPAIARTVLQLPDGELMARIGAKDSKPEGWFFPDTYFFASGSTDAALLSRAHRLMVQRLDAAWAKRASDTPLRTPYEALVLASIIEKETGSPADRPLIASVLVNRLRHGMRLQADPTVIYGLGAAFDGNLRKRDLEADSPYNTYLRDGLPPTPIALPSVASIEAAVNPPRTEYLYFVARGDGTSVFSSNLADHNRAVAKFQKALRP